MKKGMFTGWKDVFAFTFVQNTKSKTFKGAIIGIALLIFAIFFAVNVITGYYKDNKKNKKESNIENIESVILLNDTALDNDVFEKYKEYSKYIAKAELYIEGNMSLEETEEMLSEKSGVIIKIYQGEDDEDGNINYMIDVYSTEDITKKERRNIGNEISDYFDSVKYTLTDVDEVVLNMAMSDVVAHGISIEDEEESLSEILMKIFLPMIFVLVIYMMILMHGQSISKSLVVEKNSKLMETLLISVKPYAIIFGKVLAMYLIALFQMAVWIISGVLGFVIGDKVAESMFEHYSNPITDVIGLMREGSGAFGAAEIAMAIVAFAVGFLFYCVLSALLTSNITKTEELANGSSVYQIVVVIGFMAAYLLPLMQEESVIVKILRYIPFTSAFMLPADVIVGNIGIIGSVCSVGIMFITTLVMIVITGKIYKKKVF